MKTSNSKKRFVLSLVVTVLSIAMLIGSTFAWFTDSVTSDKNKIVAGNLDIEVSCKNSNGEWVSIEGQDCLFDKNALWEPGHTEYVTLKIENKGTLALNYKFDVTPVIEKPGTNVAGNSFKLSDYLMFGSTEASETEPTYADRAAARAAVTATATGLNQASLVQAGTMTAGANAQYVSLVVYMPEEVGNEANYKTGTDAPEIEMGVKVEATQLTSERDSFDDQYDKNAWVVMNADSKVTSAEELKEALTNGGLIAVTKDINEDITLDTNGKNTEVNLAGSTVKGTVTAKDAVTISGTGKISNKENKPALQVSAFGKKVTLDGASVVSGKSKAVDLSNNSKLVINSGSVERTEESNTGFNQLIFANDDAEIEINGGDFKHDTGDFATIVKFDDNSGKLDVTDGKFQVGNISKSQAKVIELDGDVVGDVKISNGDYVVKGSQGSVVKGGAEGTKVVIDGGNFKVGNTSYLVYSSNAEVVINNCTFVSDMSISSGSPQRSYIFNVSDKAKVIVKGGTYTLEKAAGTVRICSSGQDAKVILEGDTFNVQPSKSATIADGYKEVDNGDGTWSVVVNE